VTNIAIYRTVQESLTNIARHAHTAQAAVTIRRPAIDPSGSDCITLAIKDHGTGIPVNGAGAGFGLLGMRERISALGGSLSFSEVPLGGTRIEVVLPVLIGARSVS
ncbi:MAG: ATP-binding protein, partial [Pseudomonadota bacterium]